MTKNIKTFNNRGEFANTKLDKYYSKAPNTVISDIGAGFGHMEQKVESLKAVWQPFDYFKKIEKSKVWDLNKVAPLDAEKAGMVLFLEVLGNPMLAIQNIAKHIEKGGFLILSTPNPQSSKNTFHLFLKGTLYAFQKKHLKEHHVFTPWEHIVRYFLETNGFEILEYAIIDMDYKKSKSKSLKDAIKMYIEKYIEYRNVKAQGMSYGLVAKKVV
jgi:2-polyprenyl-3-methyl-5-hydroxy-6-metoxy-1,4-benzoquinol methylase